MSSQPAARALAARTHRFVRTLAPFSAFVVCAAVAAWSADETIAAAIAADAEHTVGSLGITGAVFILASLGTATTLVWVLVSALRNRTSR